MENIPDDTILTNATGVVIGVLYNVSTLGGCNSNYVLLKIPILSIPLVIANHSLRVIFTSTKNWYKDQDGNVCIYTIASNVLKGIVSGGGKLVLPHKTGQSDTRHICSHLARNYPCGVLIGIGYWAGVGASKLYTLYQQATVWHDACLYLKEQWSRIYQQDRNCKLYSKRQCQKLLELVKSNPKTKDRIDVQMALQVAKVEIETNNNKWWYRIYSTEIRRITKYNLNQDKIEDTLDKLSQDTSYLFGYI